MSNQPPETSRAQSDTIDELSSFTNLLRHRDENEVEKTLEERFQVEFDFSDVEAECNQMIKEVNQLEIQFNTQNQQIDQQPLDVLDYLNSDSDEYDRSKGEPIDDLVINLGTDDIPRINCANHIMNNAIRASIKNHPIVCADLKKLNKFAAHLKRSTELNNIFQQLKCRLRLENDTRWGSAFLLLEIIKKAFDKKAFDESIDPALSLPVDINTINMYIKILKPAYLLKITFQSNKTSIADVIPGVLNLFHLWTNMKPKLSITNQQFCNLLIQEFKKKYKYELSSNLYKVNLFQLSLCFIL